MDFESHSIWSIHVPHQLQRVTIYQHVQGNVTSSDYWAWLSTLE